MNILVLAGKHPDTQSFSADWFHALSAYEGGKHRVEFWNSSESAFEVFDRVKPDLVWAHSHDLSRGLTRVLKEEKKRLILFVGNYEHAISKEIGHLKELVDCGYSTAFSPCFSSEIVSQQTGWKEKVGVRTLSCLAAVNLHRHSPVPSEEKHKSNISFIGQYEVNKAKNINEFVFPLLHDFDLKIYGYGAWPVANYLGSLNRETFNKVICSSHINMSISSKDSIMPSERIFKIMACGRTPLIHLSNQNYKDICPFGWFFRSKLELFEQISLMFARPQEYMQKQVLEFVKENHDYQDRVKKVLEIV